MEMNQKKQLFSLPLLASNFASVFGDGIYRFALNWFLVATFGDAKLLGWLTGFGFVVFLACDLLVGILLDRYNRKLLLMGADLGGGIGLLILAWFLNPNQPQIWLLFVITFILNVDISFAYPAGRSILPDVIQRDRVARFNAWISMAFTSGQALGPLAGGVLLSFKWIDLRIFLLIYGVMLIITAGINALIRYHPEPMVREDTPIFQSIIAGYQYVFKTPKLFESMLLAMWANFFFEGFLIATPYLVQKIYGGDASSYSSMLSFAAIAGLLAGVVLARLPQLNSLKTAYLDLIVMGVALIIGAFLPILPVLTLLVILAGCVRTAVTVKVNTVNQQESQPNYLGRVMSISFFSIDLWVPLIVIMIGYIVEPLGAKILLMFGLLLLIGIGTIYWFVKKR
ncbi:MFS transporter [Weissella diestrammenae]|uniref:MFS transporter n=1 Tax=Weissella diestrammenae TaxID=1162633 RepID=A0A7G9T5L2_9LACO|nr:MFS transporter [Weissella diestrammenae]MCM0582214.1 MFS transporter [Weissella diestrammenae]QNN75387.1 MFS transporter [Weissella diestrammenae]